MEITQIMVLMGHSISKDTKHISVSFFHVYGEQVRIKRSPNRNVESRKAPHHAVMIGAQ